MATGEWLEAPSSVVNPGFDYRGGAGLTAAQIAAGAPYPVAHTAAGGLVDKDGASILSAADVSGLAHVTNPAALIPFCQALQGAVESDVIILGAGDSLTQFGGHTGTTDSTATNETFGYLARLRAELNRRIGTIDGGQWCPAFPGTTDTRVVSVGAPGSIVGYAPELAETVSNAVNRRRAANITSGTDGCTWTMTGRYCTLIWWENAGTYVGTWSYSIDGGAATNVTSTGQTDTFRTLKIDLGTYASHTVTVARVTGSIAMSGALFTPGAGVATVRCGVGGTHSNDWATTITARARRATFRGFAAGLQIIRLGHNDAALQGTTGASPSQFKINIQALINEALLNTSTKALLLLPDPVPSTTATPFAYSDYWPKLAELAAENPKVAYLDINAALNSTYASGNTAGWYRDAVHRTASGFQAEAKIIADVLLSPALLGS